MPALPQAQSQGELVIFVPKSCGCSLPSQCDQQQPGCMRCEKSRVQCPGYRDLTEIDFRDESARVAKRAHTSYGRDEKQVMESRQLLPPDARKQSGISSLAPTQPITKLAANFFFTNFTCVGPPFSETYQSWLADAYGRGPSNHPLRVAIEAVGLAGLSNMYYAPEIAAKAKQAYGRALAATNGVLDDPAVSLEDTTLLTVILLGLFEASKIATQISIPSLIRRSLSVLKHGISTSPGRRISRVPRH